MDREMTCLVLDFSPKTSCGSNKAEFNVFYKRSQLITHGTTWRLENGWTMLGMERKEISLAE